LILERQVGSIVSLLELKLLGNINEADSVYVVFGKQFAVFVFA